MNTTDINQKPFPYPYGYGYYEAVFAGLCYRWDIPGVKITDRDLFVQFIESEKQLINAKIEEYRNTGTVV